MCVCAVATLYAVLVAARRRRLAVAWLAFALAGLGFAAHPTGFTLLAPLVAGLPLLWPLVAVPGDRSATAVRALAVASGGMVAPLLAFVDGGAARLPPRPGDLPVDPGPGELDHGDPALRASCSATVPMGNYAKRAAVLLCLVALVWFGAARRRGPDAAGAAADGAVARRGRPTALAFAALWLTPSKWTHHFGALAGVGSAFLALFLALAVPTVRSVLGIGAAALRGGRRGGRRRTSSRSRWAGTARTCGPTRGWTACAGPRFPPAISHVVLDSPLLWLVVLVVVVGALVVSGRVRRHPRRAAQRAARRADPRGDLAGGDHGLHGRHVRAGRRAGRAAGVAVGAGPGRPDGAAVRRGGGDGGARPVHGGAAGGGARAARAARGDRVRRERRATTRATARREPRHAGCGAASWPTDGGSPDRTEGRSRRPGTRCRPDGHRDTASPPARCPTAAR